MAYKSKSMLRQKARMLLPKPQEGVSVQPNEGKLITVEAGCKKPEGGCIRCEVSE